MRNVRSPHSAGRRPKKGRGFVLIVVVAILVLLALMGTAYIATVRIDRQQITGAGSGNIASGGMWVLQPNPALMDQAVGAAIGQIQSVIAQELFDANFTPQTNWRLRYPRSQLYLHYLSPDSHRWLADRIPDAQANGTDPVWAHVSGWPIWHADPAVKDPTKIDYTKVPHGESPWNKDGGMGPGPKRDFPNAVGLPYDTRTQLEPTWVMIQYPNNFTAPSSLAGRIRVYPGLRDKANGNAVYLAADADGDGIADSILFRVDVPTDTNVWDAGGGRPVTYYAAWRVIDHNSAIDLNTAWSRDTIIPLFQGAFRSNTGLQELDAVVATDMATVTGLTAYRFSGAANATPYGDDGAPRTEFVYGSPQELQEAVVSGRAGNPGVNGGRLCRALSPSESAALAHRFGLISLGAAPVQTESVLLNAAYRNAPNYANNISKRWPYYPCNLVGAWFNTSFNFDAASRNSWISGQSNPAWSGANVPQSVRNLVTTSALTAAGYPPHDMSALSPTVIAAMPPDPAPPAAPACRVSINSAEFGELWKGFWEVMCKDTDPGVVPDESNGATGIYRTLLRSGTVMDPYQVLQIRAALAAINAIDLRSSTMDVTSRHIVVGDWDVMIYGTKRQPYITEVYAQTDTSPGTGGKINAKGYVAIELYNPYPDDIVLDNWNLGVLDRTGGATPLTLKPITGFAGFPVGTKIKANSYLVLENYKSDDSAPAKYRPASAAVTGTTFTVPNLGEVFKDGSNVGGELVILRPRRASGVLGAWRKNPAGPVDPADYDETILADLVPVDSFDFTGVTLPQGGNGQPTLLHYVRANGAGALWKHVYPGTYDGTKTEKRQEGTQADKWDPASQPEPAPTVPVTLGDHDVAASYTENLFPPIQLYNVDWAGPNRILGNTGNKFPFGGFARLGDILEVPFIGSYRIRQKGNGLLAEMNPVTQDSARAEDGDKADDSTECIGRFCPTPTVGAPATPDHYAWAGRLFDYFSTIANPNDDTLPNAPHPDMWLTGTAYKKGDRVFYSNPSKNVNTIFQCKTDHTSNTPPPDNNWTAVMYLQPVRNGASGSANAGSENAAPIQGLININTAGWKVLSMLPLVVDPTTGAVDVGKTEDLAKEIVADRAANGPFKTIFELNRLPSFQTMKGAIPDFITFDPGAALGDHTGDGKVGANGKFGPDGVTGDFEARYLALTRISNLITTHSDTFTCYVLIQAWQDSGTQYPVLVGERRTAFILDRTAISDPTQLPVQITVPTSD